MAAGIGRAGRLLTLLPGHPSVVRRRQVALTSVVPIENPMEEAMQSGLKLSLVAGAACLFLQAAPEVRAQGGVQGSAALTGVVTSEAEGAMEGVVVTARKAGA